ncbi:MAG: hypothetical protein JWO15_2592 [Sphingomonadales bacterium]|nr:hypothetical protein [Sphingomonadales bacterium]
MPAMTDRLSTGPVKGRLAGKIAIVTGAGGGQGLGVARLFAQAGATVIASDISPQGVKATQDIAEREGLSIDMSVIDVSSANDVNPWIEGIARRYGGIDILYNNAASTRFAPFGEMALEDWQETLRLELDVVFIPTRAVWAHMIARGGGSVINIASISGMRGLGYLGAAGHATGKAGVIGLTRQLATEGAPHWIRVNAISPGPIVTPVTETLIETSPDFNRDFHGASVLARPGRPIDIAYAGLFLASDESSYVSGINLPVDGAGSSKASHTDH